MSKSRRKLSIEIDSAMLSELRTLAVAENRDVQSLIEEALLLFIATRFKAIRPEVMAAYSEP